MSTAADPSEGHNPYVAPQALATDPTIPVDDARAFRLACLPAEGTVKLIGLFYLINILLIVIHTGLTLSSGRLVEEVQSQAKSPLITADLIRGFIIGTAVVGIILDVLFGLGLRMLWNVIRWVVVVLIALQFLGGIFSLLTVPASLGVGRGFGDAIAAFLPFVSGTVYLVFAVFLGGSSASPVFTREYKEVIAASPDLHPSLGGRDRLFIGLYATAALLNLANLARVAFLG